MIRFEKPPHSTSLHHSPEEVKIGHVDPIELTQLGALPPNLNGLNNYRMDSAVMAID